MTSQTLLLNQISEQEPEFVRSRTRMLTMVLLPIWCLLFPSPSSGTSNFSQVSTSDLLMSDLPDFHSTDSPGFEPLLQTSHLEKPNLVQETDSLLGKTEHAVKLKHLKPEKHPHLSNSNSSASVRTSLPTCTQEISIKTAFKYINTVMSCVIFAVGMIGNATLLRIIYQNKNMRNGPNALIASLALGDLIYIAIDIPITIYKVACEAPKLSKKYFILAKG